ncbi:hypothetical protein CAEBREN_07886 [Caenorhabditis brenneri]|uniref:Uncharacterized protein n=1 Tax=Caenorhabditis brenneri TaxID=135651 RepID=G0MWQ2_CAEBE|nr:hypothetical protein CAEBREN_07886 [Caenorhabditis brenneri]
MSVRYYDIPTENGWTTVRVELQDREYKIFLKDQLHQTFPDIAPTFRLTIEQIEVDIQFRTPKNHRVLATFGSFSIFNKAGSNFHFWE